MQWLTEFHLRDKRTTSLKTIRLLLLHFACNSVITVKICCVFGCTAHKIY